MKEDIREFIDRYGSFFGFIRLIFYPVTTILTTPIRMIQTLWACRRLMDGRWENFLSLRTYNALNYLFYMRTADNLIKFGRYGVSPIIGLGNYALSNWFHYSLPSLYAYRIGGIMVPIFGMFGWLVSHFVWLENVGGYWVLIIIMIIFFTSTTFYSQTFTSQNYNALGWIFMPLGIYGILNGYWSIASLAWFASSFGSFTVVFLASIFSFSISISTMEINPILTIIPANIKLLTHFLPFIRVGDFKTSIGNILKAIGVSDQNTNYKRTLSKSLRVDTIYYLIIYAQFTFFCFMITNEISILMIVGITIFLVNAKFFRFADKESIVLLLLSFATAEVIKFSEPVLVLSYVLLASPIPLFTGFASSTKILDVLPKLSPFTLDKIFNGLYQFLDPVEKNKRIFMAFENPNNDYDHVFDGYEALLEAVQYIATKKEIHFMPDWWGVFELNYEGATTIWGREPNIVMKNIEQWEADYVVVYQMSGTELEPKWEKLGFKKLSKFSWAEYQEYFLLEKPYSGATPDWWLLKVP